MLNKEFNASIGDLHVERAIPGKAKAV